MAERTIEKVVSDVKAARVNKQALNWSIKDLTEDIGIVCGEILVNLPKVDKGNQAAAKRVRDYTKVLETLGKDFRKASVK
jgi:hypothetical protein